MSQSPNNATKVRVKFAGDPVEREITFAQFFAAATAQGLGGTVNNAAVAAAIAEDPASARSAAGLNDGLGKIPSSLMPSSIPATVVLSDTSAVALSAGSLGGTATGIGLVIHDGSRVGGIPIPVGYDDRKLSRAIAIPSASIIAGDTSIEIGRLKMPSAYYDSGQVVNVIIRGFVEAHADYAGSNLGIGLEINGEADYIGNVYNGSLVLNLTSGFTTSRKFELVASLTVSEPATGQFAFGGGSGLRASFVTAVGGSPSASGTPVVTPAPSTGGAVDSDIIVTARAFQDASMSAVPIVMFAEVELLFGYAGL